MHRKRFCTNHALKQTVLTGKRLCGSCEEESFSWFLPHAVEQHSVRMASVCPRMRGFTAMRLLLVSVFCVTRRAGKCQTPPTLTKNFAVMLVSHEQVNSGETSSEAYGTFCSLAARQFGADGSKAPVTCLSRVSQSASANLSQIPSIFTVILLLSFFRSLTLSIMQLQRQRENDALHIYIMRDLRSKAFTAQCTVNTLAQV